MSYPLPGGNSGTMRGYLVQPLGQLCQLAESDERTSAIDSAAALKAGGAAYPGHVHAGTYLG